MKYTHRSQGPRKGTGNAFVPGRIEPSRRKRRNTLSAIQIQKAQSVEWTFGELGELVVRKRTSQEHA